MFCGEKMGIYSENPVGHLPGKLATVPATDMKNSPLTTLLLALLTASALFSIIICWLYVGRTREIRYYKVLVGQIENNRRLAQSLAAEAVEYSKKNPAIDPLLESAGIKAKAAPAATNKPPAK